MKTEHAVPARINPDCEIRLGDASWDETQKSVKFAWFDKNGKVARGGEFPVEALPQALEFAILKGYLTINPE